MDRFLQSLSMKHFDAGLGLYRRDRVQAANWARELVAVVVDGMAGGAKGS